MELSVFSSQMLELNNVLMGCFLEILIPPVLGNVLPDGRWMCSITEILESGGRHWMEGSDAIVFMAVVLF